jgi:hypothetical protein
VSDAVRGYLGARFGFDGLESTSDEILTALKKQASGFVRLDSAAESRPESAGTDASGATAAGGAAGAVAEASGAPRRSAAPRAPSPGVPLDEIRQFLAECDLVKFANLTPSPDQCASALTSGEHIVRGTMPFSAPGGLPPRAPTAAAAPKPHEPDEGGAS